MRSRTQRTLRLPSSSPLVDRSEPIFGHTTEYSLDAALVDGPMVVDERVGRLREAALAWRKLRVERALTACHGGRTRVFGAADELFLGLVAEP
jgi:hypothetical protein